MKTFMLIWQILIRINKNCSAKLCNCPIFKKNAEQFSRANHSTLLNALFLSLYIDRPTMKIETIGPGLLSLVNNIIIFDIIM